MSADNGYIVCPVYQDPRHRHGIFYYCASMEYDATDFAFNNAVSVHASAVDAILCAFDLDFQEGTEYGVSVFPQTRYSARQESNA